MLKKYPKYVFQFFGGRKKIKNIKIYSYVNTDNKNFPEPTSFGLTRLI